MREMSREGCCSSLFFVLGLMRCVGCIASKHQEGFNKKLVERSQRESLRRMFVHVSCLKAK